MSLHDTQRSIEYMYDKTRIPKMVRDDIESTPEIVVLIDKTVLMLESVYLMGPHFNQKNLYLSNINSYVLRETIERILEIVMLLPNGLTFTSLVGQTANGIPVSKLESFKIVSSVISYMYFGGLVKIIRAGDAQSEMMEVVPVYVCDSKILKYVDKTKYLPPMVCTPNKLRDNKSQAYLTRKPKSLICKSHNHHDGDICLDSLNKFNSIAFSLDVKMLTTFNEIYKIKDNTPQKERQFSVLREQTYDVCKLLIQSGNDFHFTHKVDKRGRTYSSGYSVNYQGNSFRKSIINLAHKELVDGTFQ